MAIKINKWTQLAVAGMLLGSHAFGQAKPDSTKSSAAKPATKAKPDPSAQPAAANAGGLVVFVDPVTHQIRPAEQGEINSLTKPPAAATQRKTAATPNKVIQGPGAAVGIVLPESTMQYMVVTKAADGSLKEECVTGSGNAKSSLIKSPAIKPAPPQTKGELDVQ